MPKLRLTLYVSGANLRSERTIACLTRILEGGAGTGYELTICDVLAQPQAAERDKVLATPTLILSSPPPSRRIVGDLADAARVLPLLDLPFRRGVVGVAPSGTFSANCGPGGDE